METEHDWKIRHQNILNEIERKKKFVQQQEENIDLSKPEKYNMAIIGRLKREGQFLDDLMVYMIHTEDLVNNAIAINRRLEIQNTINFNRADVYYKKLEEKFTTELKTWAGNYE